MLLQLLRHPQSPASPIEGISAEAVRAGAGRVNFRFEAIGCLASVRLPLDAPARRDELWRHTCFEAFVAPPSLAPYLELNFAPSHAWAAYRFDGYRSGMDQADMAAPKLEVQRGSLLTLTAAVELAPFAELVPSQTWRLGLSAVIEAKDGSLSYWALAHPPGKPDFHHADCFAAQLAPDAGP